jgi:hypothetical protein
VIFIPALARSRQPQLISRRVPGIVSLLIAISNCEINSSQEKTMEEIGNYQNQARESFNVDGYCIFSTGLSRADCALLSAEVERIHDNFLNLQIEFPHLKKISVWSVGNPHHASSLIH